MPPSPIRGLRVCRSGGPSLAAPGVRAAPDSSADRDGPDVMTVAFSRFNAWYEIDDVYEGRFLERTLPGSFKRSIGRLDNGKALKVLFNHGRDASMGSQVLGVPSLLVERDDSPYMEVPLLDGVPPLIVAGLRSGAYGSSFMFEVVSESWDYDPDPSNHNPNGLPERSILEVKLFEAGPVTWPANPDSTAGLRSGAEYVRQDDDIDVQERLYAAFRAAHGLNRVEPLPVRTAPVSPATAPVSPRRTGVSAADRAARIQSVRSGR